MAQRHVVVQDFSLRFTLPAPQGYNSFKCSGESFAAEDCTPVRTYIQPPLVFLQATMAVGESMKIHVQSQSVGACLSCSYD